MTFLPVQRDELTATFLDAAGQGRFLLRRCTVSGDVLGPQFEQCPSCGSTELEWVAAGGGASVVSWSVIHGRATDGAVPPMTVVAIAELDEGPWWWSQILDADPSRLAAGAPLRVDFVRPEGSEAIPVFRLV